MSLLDDARNIAKKHKLHGVLIIGISLSSGTLPSASYGSNKRLCKHFAVVLDKLLADFESGKIPLYAEESDGEEV